MRGSIVDAWMTYSHVIENWPGAGGSVAPAETTARPTGPVLEGLGDGRPRVTAAAAPLRLAVSRRMFQLSADTLSHAHANAHAHANPHGLLYASDTPPRHSPPPLSPCPSFPTRMRP